MDAIIAFLMYAVIIAAATAAVYFIVKSAVKNGFKEVMEEMRKNEQISKGESAK